MSDTTKKMYQAKHKERFMKRVKNDRGYVWLFDVMFDYENKFGKDLYNFNKEEILEFMSSRKMTFDSLKVYLSNIRTYINWAYEEGIKSTSSNAADEITDEDIENVSRNKRSLLTADEVYEVIRHPRAKKTLPPLKNYQDRLLVYLLFLGVRGDKASELINLKIDHIDFENKLIKLSEMDEDRKDLRVDDFCLQLILNTKNEKEYFRYMDEDNFDTTNTKEYYDLAESNYIFRKSNVGKKSKDSKMSYAGIIRRLQTLSKYTGLKLTMNTVETSGITYVAKKVINAGHELKIDNPTVIKSIFERFNINNTPNSRHTLLTKIRKNIKEVYPEDSP